MPMNTIRFRGSVTVDAASVQRAYAIQGNARPHLEKVEAERRRHEQAIQTDLPDSFHLRFHSVTVINGGRIFPADNVTIHIDSPFNPQEKKEFLVTRHMGEDMPGFWQRLLEEAKTLKEDFFFE